MPDPAPCIWGPVNWGESRLADAVPVVVQTRRAHKENPKVYVRGAHPCQSGMSFLTPHRSPHCCTSPAGFGGAHRVSAGVRRHNEGFGVMHAERFEVIGRALNDSLFPFDEVQNIYLTPWVVFHGCGKPVPPRLDELRLV